MNTKPDGGKRASDVSVCAVIAAAGNGTRMGGISKPEIRLDGKTLFARVLTAFLGSCVREIVVVCGENRERLEHIAAELHPQKPIRFCTGGKERSASVYNGVQQAGRDCSFICVHDCARPFVTSELIDSVIRAAVPTGAATACTAVTDTVKYIDEERHTVYTPKREHLLAIQTPQVFRRDFYEVAYALSLKSGETYTDESALLEVADAKVAYVKTDARNIKLTTKADIVLARAQLWIEKQGENT